VLAFYRALGVPDAGLVFVKDVPAGHAFLSPLPGGACGATAAPFVNQCMVDGAAYDQPHAILGHIYGTLQPKASTLSSAPVAFDQAEFAGPAAGMAKSGYAYIPAACAGSAKCAVHVVFHGCQQSAKLVGEAVYRKAGYNEWADSNRIILLYPQIDPQPNIFAAAFNPQGCWDWWGATGVNFQSRSGAQLSAVHAMIERLLKP
jgi:poly(3-hydroxybutyrate) depolymerase